jgi:hypothetical protein
VPCRGVSSADVGSEGVAAVKAGGEDASFGSMFTTGAICKMGFLGCVSYASWDVLLAFHDNVAASFGTV